MSGHNSFVSQECFWPLGLVALQPFVRIDHKGDRVVSVVQPCALDETRLFLCFETFCFFLCLERVLVLGPIRAADLDVVPVSIFYGALMNAHLGLLPYSYELLSSLVITVIITLVLDYGRSQGPCHNYLMAKKVDPADLVGAHEIAERMGLSFPNVVHTWRKRHPDFPQPIAELQAGLIWDWHDIAQWLKATKRLSS